MTITTTDERYPARCVVWDSHEPGTVDILDEQGNVIRTLDDWQTLAFHSADANHSVAEQVAALRQRPAVDEAGREIDPIPPFMQALTALTEEFAVVELRDGKSDLEPTHDLPLSQHHLLE